MRNSPRTTLLNKQNALSFFLFFFFLTHSTLLLPLLLLGSKQAKCEKQTFLSPSFWGLITAKCQVRCQPPQHQTLLSRLQTILQQHLPRKKSILEGESERALMPISPPIAASTELNACTSPPQQPFNNLSNQARHSTPQHGFHSHFFLTRQTYYTCLFFSFLLSIAPALPLPHVYDAQSPVLWAFVRSRCEKHGKTCWQE